MRCWLHFQQEASKLKIRICLPRIPTKVLCHVASCHCSTRAQSVPRQCSWKGRGLLEQFKRRPDTVESAWSAGRKVPEMLWAPWSNSQLKNPQGRRASASTGGSAAGNGLWALGWAVPTLSQPGWAKRGRESKHERDVQEVCYVRICAVEGMETNSRRIFLAISILFCAIISAFWMSW